jgi:Flp pilus assembly protein TadD
MTTTEIAAACNASGIGAFKKGDIAGATQCFNSTLAADSLNAYYHIKLAVAIDCSRTLYEQIKLYERAPALAPGDPVIVSNLTSVLNEAATNLEAEQQAKPAVEPNHKFINAKQYLANAPAGSKKWVPAAQQYELVLRVHPDLLHVPLSTAKAQGPQVLNGSNCAMKSTRQCSRLFWVARSRW